VHFSAEAIIPVDAHAPRVGNIAAAPLGAPFKPGNLAGQQAERPPVGDWEHTVVAGDIVARKKRAGHSQAAGSLVLSS